MSSFVRAAVIDVGTNSIKLLVAEKSAAGFTVLDERINAARLGEGLSVNGRLAPAAINRGAAAVADFVSAAGVFGAAEVAVLGTHAIRKARNRSEFIRKVKELSGADLRVLSEEEEARCSLAAAMEAAGPGGRALVFDAGGGSTEFILGTDGTAELVRSAPVGALTLYEKCMSVNDPPPARDFQAACRFVRRYFRQAADVVRAAGSGDFTLIGTGGLISVLACVALKLEEVGRREINGTTLTKAEIKAQIALYASLTAEQRKNIPGMPADRALLAPAGAALALSALWYTGKDTLRVSGGGLRHGAMSELLKKYSECR